MEQPLHKFNTKHIKRNNRKNRLRREWQSTHDPSTKHLLNAKIIFIRAMLQTHKQDKWDSFLNSLEHHECSIYKHNKTLLHKQQPFHPFIRLKKLFLRPSTKLKC